MVLNTEKTQQNNNLFEKDENSLGSTTKTETTVITNKKCHFDYSYVVLFSAFIAYMFASLLGSCFGVIFDSLETELNIGRSKVAFIGALLSSLDNLLGPVASAFINRYGCRKTTILGGLLTSIGVIGSAYVTDFWLLGLLMGCVSGFGSSLVVVSTVVVATYYFEDKPSFASGFVISGGSLGPTLFPLIIIQLNDIYGRSGCFLILGALILNIVVCGALFKPLYWELEGYVEEELNTEEDEKSEEILIDDEYDDLSEDFDFKFNSTKLNQENVADKYSLNDKTVNIQNHHQHHHHRYNHPYIPNFMIHFPLNLRNYYYKSLLNLNTRLLSRMPPAVLSSSKSPLETSEMNVSDPVSVDCKTKISSSCPNLTIGDKETKIDDLKNHDFTLEKQNASIQNTKQNTFMTAITAANRRQSKLMKDQCIDGCSTISGSETTCNVDIKLSKLIKSLLESIKSTLKLFRIIEFTIFVICNLILGLFYQAPFYFINSYMTENDFTHNEAGIVNVAVGVAGIIASITYGFIGDIKRLNWILLYSFSIYLTSLCHFALPFIIHNYALTMITMILISMFISVSDVLVPIICVHTVGNDDFVSAYGLMFFCQGISSLLGPPILGMIIYLLYFIFFY